jgi:hypothetical protein
MSNYGSMFYKKDGSTTLNTRRHILGHRWYGHRTNFPGFNHKRPLAGLPVATNMYPGSQTSLTTNQNIDNIYIRGSGVGAIRTQLRRYKTARASDGTCICGYPTSPGN